MEFTGAGPSAHLTHRGRRPVVNQELRQYFLPCPKGQYLTETEVGCTKTEHKEIILIMHSTIFTVYLALLRHPVVITHIAIFTATSPS